MCGQVKVEEGRSEKHSQLITDDHSQEQSKQTADKRDKLYLPKEKGKEEASRALVKC